MDSGRNINARLTLEQLEARCLMHAGHDHDDLEAGNSHDAYDDALLEEYASLANIANPVGTQASALAASPATEGSWGPVQDWSVEAIHAALLPTGSIMMWDRSAVAQIWDPETNTFQTPVQAGYNQFCANTSLLTDGRLLSTGGHIVANVGLSNASIYDPFSETWTALPPMNDARWYPTNVTMADGDALVMGGEISPEAGQNPLPQVLDIETQTWRDLTGAQLSLPYYPRIFAAPNGQVFYAGHDETSRYLDTAGVGKWTVLAERTYANRDYGAAVMYEGGKVLYIGGGTPATNTVEMIDLNSANPTWQAMAPMHHARRNVNATLLPDGKILVTGGNDRGHYDDPVYSSEVWDPATNTWTLLPDMAEPRWYHSTALLMPDGRIMSAGGDFHFTAEVYSPSYLFQGVRPTISSAPESFDFGDTFAVSTPDASSITSVTMLRLGTTTHAFNSDQRFAKLSFTRSFGTLNVTAPTNDRVAIPGYYMLFVLRDGVPSEAKIVRLGDAEVPDPVGPLASGLTVLPNNTASTPPTITVRLDDTLTSQATVTRAEYWIDQLGAAGTGIAMSAQDGAFNSMVETARATLTAAQFNALSIGTHTIYVHGRDATGDWGPAIEQTFVKASQGPVTSNLKVAPVRTAVAPTITAVADDTAVGASTISGAEYFIDTIGVSGDGTPMNAVDGAFNEVREPITFTLFNQEFEVLTSGAHTVHVHARDAELNWGSFVSFTFRKDISGPLTQQLTVTPVTNTTPPTITASISDANKGGSPIGAAEFFIDAQGASGTGIPFTPSDGGFNSPTEAVTAKIPTATYAALSAGTHTIYAHGKDQPGNWGAFVTKTFTKGGGDSVGPVTTVVKVVNTPTNVPPNVTAKVSDVAQGNSVVQGAELFIDTVGAVGTGIVMAPQDGSFSSTLENVGILMPAAKFASLAEGSHVAYVRGRDAAGNWGATAQVGFKKDTLGPVSSNVVISPKNTSTAPSITAQVNDGNTGKTGIAAAEYFIDTQGVAGTGRPFAAFDGTFNATSEKVSATMPATVFNGLSVGTHTLYVRGQDRAGNWGALVSSTFTKVNALAAAQAAAMPSYSSASSSSNVATPTVGPQPAASRLERLFTSIQPQLVSTTLASRLGPPPTRGRAANASAIDLVLADWQRPE